MTLALVLFAVLGAASGWVAFLIRGRRYGGQRRALLGLQRNLLVMRDEAEDQQKADTDLARLDEEVVNAKTPEDAVRVRRSFVSLAYHGMRDD